MSDPNDPLIAKRDTPHWSLYQRENFWKPSEGELPLFNTGISSSYHKGSLGLLIARFTDPGKLEELAKEKLTQGGW